MAEMRWFRTWTPDELSVRLAFAADLPANLPEQEAELSPELGWNRVLSQAVVGREPAGPPEEDGAFARARALVCRFAFSDARIVVGHWRPNAHLRQRTLLLELKALGAHALVPVRIARVREASDDARTVFGYQFETLSGHVERGREWFLLSKDHATGEVSFNIEAGWRPGEFPNWWSQLGFHLVGRRYQRAWHRLAHEHLRAALQDFGGAQRRARGAAPEHGGLALAPVQFFAQKAQVPPRLRADREAEVTRRDAWWRAAAFGAVAGLRTALPPALLAVERSHRSQRGDNPAGGDDGQRARRLARVLQLCAAGELLADKVPGMPPRTHPLALLARAASGALAGAALLPRRRGPGALLGAAAAVLAAVGAVRLRRVATGALHLPDALWGAAEDLLAISAGARLASSS